MVHQLRKQTLLTGRRAGILGAIGDTPLIELTTVGPSGVGVYAKLELLNPGGSAKDRPAVAILEDAIGRGVIEEGTRVVESSSGNMGIGLAQACRYYDLPFTCVVDQNTTIHAERLMRAYCAEVVRVDARDAPTGDLLQARLERVHTIIQQCRPAFWPNQHENSLNAAAHFEGTAREIMRQLGRAPDWVLCATSTCGTIAGMKRFFAEYGSKLLAVDIEGSRLFGGSPSPRIIPGIGASRQSGLFGAKDADGIFRVSALDCVAGCRLLASEEAVLAGGSSGGVVAAACRNAAGWPSGSRGVLVLVDRGERYLDTIFSDEWVESHVAPMVVVQHRVEDLLSPTCGNDGGLVMIAMPPLVPPSLG